MHNLVSGNRGLRVSKAPLQLVIITFYESKVIGSLTVSEKLQNLHHARMRRSYLKVKTL